MKVKATGKDGTEIFDTLADDSALAFLLATDGCEAVTAEMSNGTTLRYVEIPDTEADLRAERDRFKELYEATRTTAETLRSVVEAIAESRMSRAETIEKARRALAEVSA